MEELYNWRSPSKTKGGKEQMTAEILSQLSFPLAEIYCQWKKLSKQITTYGEAFLKHVEPDGRIRTNYNNTVTKTGRLSSSAPNTQNIPSKGELGDTTRKLFIAPPGYKLIGVDVSAFQVRILAHYLSYVDDPSAYLLANEFNNNNNADPHQKIADLCGVTRSAAKTVLFGNIFGQESKSLSKKLKLSEEETQEIINRIKSNFPAIDKLRVALWQTCANDKGLIHDLFGHAMYYPEILSKREYDVAKAKRQSFNAIIQGTEASIMKIISNALLPYCRDGRVKMVLHVHDEIVFECLESLVPEFSTVLRNVFTRRYLSRVILDCNVKIGNNWYEVH
jgi:DNA polymerase-1